MRNPRRILDDYIDGDADLQLDFCTIRMAGKQHSCCNPQCKNHISKDELYCATDKGYAFCLDCLGKSNIKRGEHLILTYTVVLMSFFSFREAVAVLRNEEIK